MITTAVFQHADYIYPPGELINPWHPPTVFTFSGRAAERGICTAVAGNWERLMQSCVSRGKNNECIEQLVCCGLGMHLQVAQLVQCFA